MDIYNEFSKLSSSPSTYERSTSIGTFAFQPFFSLQGYSIQTALETLGQKIEHPSNFILSESSLRLTTIEKYINIYYLCSPK
jgi:hypothetical protein